MSARFPFLSLLLACASSNVITAQVSLSPEGQPSDGTPIRLGRYTVQADRVSIPRDQAAARIDVISPAHFGAFATKDTADVLEFLPNVTVQRYGSVNGEAGLTLYGQSGERTSPTNTLIALDGVPLNSGLIAQTSLNLLPSILLERIEVVQGPASSSYGSNAMTGVVNLVTRRPLKTEAALEGGYGTWKTARAALYAGTGKLNDYRLVVGAQHSETDGHLQPQGNRDFSDAQIRNVALLGEKILSRTTLSAAWAYYDWDRHSPSATLPGAPLSTQFEKGSRQHLHVKGVQTLAEGWAVTVSQFRNESTERGRPALGSGSTFSQRVVNDGSLAQLTWDQDSHLLSLGAEYQAARLTDRLTGVKNRGRTHGFLVHDHLRLWRDQLALTAGLRFDETSTYDEADISPKLGISFQPENAQWRLRANYGEAFKSPTFTQIYSTRPPLGNPNLTAQSFDLLEGGIEWQALPTLQWSGTVYQAKLTDPIYPRAQPTPPFLLQFTNVAAATQVDGFYTTVLWQPLPTWRVDASYAYLDPGTSTFHTSRHVGKLGLSYQAQPVSIGVSARRETHRFWQDGFVDPVSAYTVVDLRLAYVVSPRAELFVSAENLFDETYATGAFQAGRVNNQAVWIGIERPGRFLEGGFKLNF